MPLLDRIGAVLAKGHHALRIEGHADKSEGRVAGFPSPWELSSSRASWVARRWIQRFGLNPQRIGISGYSIYRPITESRTAWGQGSNRRIEIIILPDHPAKSENPPSGASQTAPGHDPEGPDPET